MWVSCWPASRESDARCAASRQKAPPKSRKSRSCVRFQKFRKWSAATRYPITIAPEISSRIVPPAPLRPPSSRVPYQTVDEQDEPRQRRDRAPDGQVYRGDQPQVDEEEH